MNAPRLSVGLLFLGAVALGASQYLGSPWPGVVLAGLSLVPWGIGEWLLGQRKSDNETVVFERKRVDALVTTVNRHADRLHDAEGGLVEHGQQISSLRNAASLRGTLGG